MKLYEAPCMALIAVDETDILRTSPASGDNETPGIGLLDNLNL